MDLGKTEQFDEDYLSLSAEDRRRVDATIEKLAANPSLPGLRLRKLSGEVDALGRAIWYCRVSDSMRLTCIREGDFLLLRRVGHHSILVSP